MNKAMPHPPAFLGIETSLTGRRWVGPGVAVERAAAALAQTARLSPALSLVLARLGVAPDAAASYLDPKLRDLMPDPRDLRDMGQAGARMVAAVTARERIAIFADYDVDGGTSAALLVTWLRHFGLTATLYVPDRIDEGYGPNVPAMEALAAEHDLIICVDCGTLSHDALAAAKGADVIVLDHHLGGETLPPALAVVNPNRQDETGDLAHLCAAGVVFLALVECGRQLRAAGNAGPDLMAMLDLVALGTVADVAPLIGVNRAFVRQGLKIMARRERPGLVALADAARLDCAPAAYHLGYVLGPRVNAGGRVGRADLGARLLSTTDPAEAAALADRLEEVNTERREIEARVRDAALAQAEERGMDGPLVWAAGDGWHPGVVGIVASRLKEHANRPAIVIGFDGDAGKGSGRSVAGVDLGAAIQRLAREGLIEKGGGHKMAAGLSLSRAQLPAAMERLSELLAAQGADRLGPRDLVLDGTLMPNAATVDLVKDLDRAGPYGAGAPAPRFALPDCRVLHAREVGSGHLKLSLGDGLGARIDAIAFGAFDGPMGAALSGHGGARFHVAGRLEINTWQGRQSPQLALLDAAPASP
ncbi:single-stranded-DNA-specific exonuclease RecJ [Pseudaestuariivita atlantica]|uniref:Single-stranded-DNA-specific exonuclease RecJ n=1 Tax=Pseudaestuariivita atlantica TaxID=1317121 RepID=A0A0L1JML8_9RHOB|nr:single-stranded-DNA-specific exonuclease RecJ [Pseudaestuariivita atlantica]KNG92663.1 recombinase RecJ [Pseudaestuariivita atlantica]